MNGGTIASILTGVVVGIAGTVTMDVFGSVVRKTGLASGAKGQWVGRWYLGIARGQFLHDNIATAPEQVGEGRAAFAGHYLIGIMLAVFYVLGARWVGFSPSAFLVAVSYGLATCVFPWFVVFPALGFGVLGRKGPRELGLFTSSLLNHFFYGLGVWWSALLLQTG